MGFRDWFKKDKQLDLVEKNDQRIQPVIYYDSQGNPLGPDLKGLRPEGLTPKPSFNTLEIEAFGMSPWVYIIVDRIAEAAANIDSKLLNIDGEPVHSRMMQSPKYRELVRLLRKPQTETGDNTFSDVIYMLVASYLLTGNNYTLGLPSGPNRYNELIVPRASQVDVNESIGAKITSYNISYFNLNFTADPKDVLHQYRPNLTEDIHEGHSGMQTLVDVWKANNAINKNERLIHERKGANGILYGKSGKVETPTMREDKQRTMNDQLSTPSQTGRYAYISNELGFINLSASMKELQADKSKLDEMRTIAAAYKYPSELLGDPVKTYNNQKEAKKAVYDDAVLPVLDMILNGLNEWLVRGNYKMETVKIWYVRADIPQLNLVEKDKTDNQKAKSEMVSAVQKDITSGAISYENGFSNMVINMGYTEGETLLLIGMPPVEVEDEGGGDTGDPTPAQERLLGSVGGFQGILATQAAVAAGESNYEAAVETFMLMLGLSDAQSRVLLGPEQPPKAPTPET